MGFLDKLKAFFISEPPERTQYYKHKQEIEETAKADTVFWDKLDNDDKKELVKREKFLKLWEKASDLITVKFGKDKKQNMQQVLTALQLGNVECYYDNSKLRNLRLIGGQIHLLYGTVQQATNCFMQILYLDIIDDVSRKSDCVIAPSIYKWAFQENLSMEEFEKIFKFNAENIIKSVKFKIPITPDEAWSKILKYIESND